MTLSEAIRIGARIHPQCRERMFGVINHEQRTCALGAAYVATFGVFAYGNSGPAYARLEKHYPELRNVSNQIISWNDDLGLTREEIAEKLEKKLAAINAAVLARERILADYDALIGEFYVERRATPAAQEAA